MNNFNEQQNLNKDKFLKNIKLTEKSGEFLLLMGIKSGFIKALLVISFKHLRKKLFQFYIHSSSK